MSKELSYSDVSEHTSKKDLYMVIHDKIYDASSFVDEHPGGEEVMLDVAGQDATEAFEDVGHSDEAREILNGLLIGTLQRKDGDPKPNVGGGSLASSAPKPGAVQSQGMGMTLYAVLLVGGALAFFAYQYLNAKA
ncbi:cytochrome b5-like heme/steroid binding domain-containing protein [Neohortaea acidophila]|uniref:Cytochrome b5-like heme/steroid binding domain-containing protein n=1 Tax=Neohortaea acidophila TaxID=245834 RepID=A0A6A6PZM1_9PEZI|nr:cytochrome b5-like heme/steroid binding domain-containing protein [Neohortaea acidophila]KAF2485658.1 cytochrome b5-like heme/steroid binding domain-containing protein [Neohortaea acidophila]